MMYVCVQIFMKYGRQRWKLRGRIEINAKQVWDSEETVFLPLISEFLSVKVSPSQCLKPQKLIFLFFWLFGVRILGWNTVSVNDIYFYILHFMLVNSVNNRFGGTELLKVVIFCSMIKSYFCGPLGNRAEEPSQSCGCRKCFLRD